MPRISEFYGIVIYMYVREHPPPHFHAEYGDDEAVFHIETGEILRGTLPRAKLRLVRTWLDQHRSELLVNWSLVMRKESKTNPTAPMSPSFELARVIAVEPLEGFWIRVTFSDGAVMDIGFEGVFGHDAGIFKPVLEDREFFEQVQVDPAKGVVEWPGELDLDADVMYGTFKPADGRDYHRRIVRPPSNSAA